MQRSSAGAQPEDAVMSEQDWPLYEVFVRSRAGLSHKHVGTLHAADAAMALELEVASAAAAVEAAAVAAADQVIDHTNALATHRAKERR